MTNPPPSAQLQKRLQTTRNASLATGIIFALIAVFSTISTILTGLHSYSGIVLTIIVALVGFLGVYLASRQSLVGGYILLGVILAGAATMPVIAQGQGISLAILMSIIIASLSARILQGRWAVGVTVTGILLGFIVILVDLFAPNFGVPNDPAVTNVIAAAATLLYGGEILRNYSQYNLRNKLLIAFIGAAIFPLGVVGFTSNQSALSLIQNLTQSELSSLANTQAQQIDSSLTRERDVVYTQAKQGELLDFMNLTTAQKRQPENASRMVTILTDYYKRDPIFIRSYAMLNTLGEVVLSSSPEENGISENSYPHFTKVAQSSLPYVSPVYFFEGKPAVFYISAPINNENGDLEGVLRVEYDALLLQSLLQNVAPSNPEYIAAIVDAETFARLAYSGDRTLLYKSYLGTTEEAAVWGWQSQNRLPAGEISAILTPNEDIVQGLPRLDEEPFISPYSPTLKNSTIATGKSLQVQQWVLLTGASQNILYAPAEEQTRQTTLFSIAGVLAAAIISLVVAIYITRPVQELAKITEQVSGGNLHIRANIPGGDEISQLAQSFNGMTSELQQTLTNLEDTIQQRTRELEEETRKNQKRASLLQDTAEASRRIGREQDIQKLLPLAADLIARTFHLHHVGIFLIDAERRYAVLEASNSSAGQKMITEEFRMELNANSATGYAALTGKPILGEENNPHAQAQTRSQILLPLLVRGSTIGVLDLQSQTPNTFETEDTEALMVLADQVAITIEHARLLRQTQEALNIAQNVTQTYIRQEWSSLAKRKSNLSYLHSVTGGKTLPPQQASQEVELVLRHGSIIKKDKTNNHTERAILAIPIRTGEQTIGAIRIQSQTDNREWNADEINVARTIAERLSLALENARLVENSQKQASKERTIGEISAKISAATNIDNILQVAVQELGNMLSGSDVFIQFQGPAEEN